MGFLFWSPFKILFVVPQRHPLRYHRGVRKCWNVLTNLFFRIGSSFMFGIVPIFLGERLDVTGRMWHLCWDCKLLGSECILNGALITKAVPADTAKCFGSFEQVWENWWVEVNREVVCTFWEDQRELEALCTIEDQRRGLEAPFPFKKQCKGLEAPFPFEEKQKGLHCSHSERIKPVSQVIILSVYVKIRAWGSSSEGAENM